MGANILGFNGVMHSVVGDVSVDSEAPVVTSSISSICRLSLKKCSIVLCNLKNPAVVGGARTTVPRQRFVLGMMMA